jgi:anti-anti-sigma regulatory factor
MSPVLRQSHARSSDPSTRSTRIDPSRSAETAIDSHWRGDVVVLRPLGQLDRRGVEDVRDAALASARSPVVIDLSDCILTDPNALADLADDGVGSIELCFVSRRATCRLLLARTGITSRFAVFQQLEDALQARTFAASGYGHGWRRP